LNEAELEVDSEKASYKQRLEVLQQQEELIEDEEEQEQKEEDARRARREASDRSKREEEAFMAESLLPDSEVCPTRFPLLRRGIVDGHPVLPRSYVLSPRKKILA
jgi:LETM1 and EF-hand domain-containing protein 1, mitochondrial